MDPSKMHLNVCTDISPGINLEILSESEPLPKTIIEISPCILKTAQTPHPPKSPCFRNNSKDSLSSSLSSPEISQRIPIENLLRITSEFASLVPSENSTDLESFPERFSRDLS